MASLVVVLWRNIRACELDAIAMARWGYSRMRTWLDFSGGGGCPGHNAVDGGGGKLESMLRTSWTLSRKEWRRRDAGSGRPWVERSWRFRQWTGLR